VQHSQKKPRSKNTENAESAQHSIRVPHTLFARVKAAMDYEGIKSFSGFSVSALTLKVRRIEETMAREARQKNTP